MTENVQPKAQRRKSSKPAVASEPAAALAAQPPPAVAPVAKPQGPPESVKDLVWRIVSDRNATMNVILLATAGGAIVFAVLSVLAVLIFLVTQGSWITWVTAGVSGLGTGGVAALQWRHLKRGRK